MKQNCFRKSNNLKQCVVRNSQNYMEENKKNLSNKMYGVTNFKKNIIFYFCKKLVSQRIEYKTYH